MNVSKTWAAVFEILLLVFVASLFLMLGSDFPGHVNFRIGYAGGLLVAYWFVFRRHLPYRSYPSLTLLCFLALFGFEMVRWLWAFFQLHLKVPGNGSALFLLRYLASPADWSLYLGMLALGFLFFQDRGRLGRLLWVLAFSGFFLALNAAPALLMKGKMGYLGTDGRAGFFFPFFYFHPLLSKYVIARFAHQNYTGDMIALGFFPALGLFLYSLQLARERYHQQGYFREPIATPAIVLSGIAMLTTALAVILNFSARGTILCFSAVFFLYLMASLGKFPSRLQLVFVATSIFLVTLFLGWAGNVSKAWRDVQTVEGEFNPESKGASWSANLEGAKRALAIYREHPTWGAGTNGYPAVSLRYAAPGTEKNLLIKFKAMCHYLQVLAEEGMGAYLYYLFILAYLFEATRCLITARSRFQFFGGFSLFAGVLVILLHAAFNHLLDHFSTSMLVYTLMGATLGIFAREFRRA